MLFHYQFISTLKEEQWNEIDSTWLRTTFSIILGFCAGLIIRKHPYYFLFFMVGIIVLPSITTGLYFSQVDLQNKWMLNGFVGVFKGKFSGVYFVLCQVLFGFACLSAVFFSPNRSKLLMLGMSTLGGLLILSGTINGIVFQALNLILIAGLGALIFMFLVLSRSIYQFVKRRMRWLPIMFPGVILSILLAAFYGFYLYDKHHEQKLINLIGDIQVATQLEKNQTWIRDGRSIPEPVDEKGRVINGSTYERTSWFIRGAQFIAQNPWGNGITHMAFGYYMRDTYPGSKAPMTHSAWIDYTLGVGLPGFFLTWMAIVLCVRSCMIYLNHVFSRSERNYPNIKIKNAFFQNKSDELVLFNQKFIPFSGIWLILGLAFFWIVGEVSEREYIEHYFFLISFFSSCVPLLVNKIDEPT